MSADRRPAWAIVPGKIPVPVARQLPEGAAWACHEGDLQWSPAEPWARRHGYAWPPPGKSVAKANRAADGLLT